MKKVWGDIFSELLVRFIDCTKTMIAAALIIAIVSWLIHAIFGGGGKDVINSWIESCLYLSLVYAIFIYGFGMFGKYFGYLLWLIPIGAIVYAFIKHAFFSL